MLVKYRKSIEIVSKSTRYRYRIFRRYRYLKIDPIPDTSSTRYRFRPIPRGVCQCAGHLWIMFAGMACRYTWEGCVGVLGTCRSCLQVWHAGTHRKGVSVCWAPVDYACRYGMQVHMGGVCQCAGHLGIMFAGMACRYTWEGCVSVLGTCGSCLQVWHAGTHGRGVSVCWTPVDHACRYGMRVHMHWLHFVFLVRRPFMYFLFLKVK